MEPRLFDRSPSADLDTYTGRRAVYEEVADFLKAVSERYSRGQARRDLSRAAEYLMIAIDGESSAEADEYRDARAEMVLDFGGVR